MNKQRLLFYSLIFFTIIVLIVCILLFLSFGQEKQSESNNPLPQQTISPSPNLVIIEKSIAIKDLPKNGFAIDTSTPVVETSEKEIDKFRQNLPYIVDFKSSTGRVISIVVPSESYQDDLWKLTAQIFGPNYQVTTTDPAYSTEKLLFYEGVSNLFTWIKQQGADPKKIIIKWGDKAFIQERAELWVEEK
jgi:hypothetical protein